MATFDALQAFWPGLQVLAGDVSAAAATQEAFHSLWCGPSHHHYRSITMPLPHSHAHCLTISRRTAYGRTRFKVHPERYDVARSALHGSMTYYPLRPEHAESTHALYRATGSDKYLHHGAEMVASLNANARTPVGFAAIKSVVDMKLEDHTPSFFLAETLKVRMCLRVCVGLG